MMEKLGGSFIFKNAVWSFYILFICRLASVKESQRTQMPITSSRQINFLLLKRDGEEILEAVFHKQVTVFLCMETTKKGHMRLQRTL